MESVLLKQGLDLLTNAIKSMISGRRTKADDKRAAQLIAEAIRELLSISPDLPTVQAKLDTAKSIASEPSADLLRAQEMFKAVGSAATDFHSVGKSSKKKKTAKKSKKKAAKKVKKKAAKKASKKKVKKVAKKRAGR